MKRFVLYFLVFILSFMLTACIANKQVSGTTDSTISSEIIENTQTTENIPVTETTESLPVTETTGNLNLTETAHEDVNTTSTHSEYYIEGVSAEDIILYFNEVCLDSEYTSSGDPSLIQKWINPVYFMIHGEYTSQDYETIIRFTELLNSIDGFPGIFESPSQGEAGLHIYFCTQQELIERIGNDVEYEDADGAVTFWYSDENEIYDGLICCRTDLTQTLRNSVILEELYNSLSPINDTLLRPDSIIYQDYSEAQNLSETDLLILRLLYNPQIECGMDGAQCENIIRELYY